ncbi:MAG: hypothetical protein KKB65_04575, partial [Nanoarchaeota archaeon]|nr:hypothetical protein [Nanoarchaeota archaeon]
EVAEKIIELINNKELKNQIIKNINNYKKEIMWNKLMEPLDLFCKKPKLCKQSKFNVYNLLNEKQKSVEICERELITRNNELIIKNQQIKELFNIINNQKKTIEKQLINICQFKSSVIYPFFRITSGFGKTKTGKIIQKLIK